MTEIQQTLAVAEQQRRMQADEEVTSTPKRVAEHVDGPSAWRVVGQAAAMLALAMGIGRFAFTPLLPMMTADAGLSASGGAALATVNLVGYLAGAIISIAVPRSTRSRLVVHISLVAVVASLGLMAATNGFAIWAVLRFVSGVGSALLFVSAVASLHAHLGKRGSHLVGWGFGGVGAGIAASAALVLALRNVADSSTAWLVVAALGAVLAAAAWTLRPAEGPALARAGIPDGHNPQTQRAVRTRPWFIAVAISYGVEGVGYIIAATFLVAAIEQQAPGWVGDGAWIVVGLAALPSTAMWAWLTTRASAPVLLASALAIQAVGIVLVAMLPGLTAALVSAVLFGGTVIAISSLALGIGDHLQFPRGIAVLTTVYAVGQILGPLVAAPLLGRGYPPALLLSASIVAIAALTAGLLRIHYPLSLGTPPARHPWHGTTMKRANPDRKANR